MRWKRWWPALAVVLSSLCSLPVESLRASALVLQARIKAEEAKNNPPPVVEGEEGANGTSTVPAGPKLTGIPQKDYIHDPNLPRELKGQDLSTYPFYNAIPPDIEFECDGLHDGFYASVPHHCQVYHHCLFGTRYDFLCANYTAFDQKTFICHFVSEVDCDNSPKYYKRNEALYKQSETTVAPTTSTTPKPTTTRPTTAPTTEGRRPSGAGRRRRPPYRRRRPVYEYYYDDEEYDDEDYMEEPPRSRSRTQGGQEESKEEAEKPSTTTTTTEGPLKPVGPAVYGPRVPPKIRRPVPLNERDKYDYTTAKPSSSPSSSASRNRDYDDVSYEDEEDDYEDEEPRGMRGRRPHYEDRRRKNQRRRTGHRKGYRDDEEEMMPPRERGYSGRGTSAGGGGGRKRYQEVEKPRRRRPYYEDEEEDDDYEYYDDEEEEVSKERKGSSRVRGRKEEERKRSRPKGRTTPAPLYDDEYEDDYEEPELNSRGRHPEPAGKRREIPKPSVSREKPRPREEKRPIKASNPREREAPSTVNKRKEEVDDYRQTDRSSLKERYERPSSQKEPAPVTKDESKPTENRHIFKEREPFRSVTQRERAEALPVTKEKEESKQSESRTSIRDSFRQRETTLSGREREESKPTSKPEVKQPPRGEFKALVAPPRNNFKPKDREEVRRTEDSREESEEQKVRQSTATTLRQQEDSREDRVQFRPREEQKNGRVPYEGTANRRQSGEEEPRRSYEEEEEALKPVSRYNFKPRQEPSTSPRPTPTTPAPTTIPPRVEESQKTRFRSGGDLKTKVNTAVNSRSRFTTEAPEIFSSEERDEVSQRPEVPTKVRPVAAVRQPSPGRKVQQQTDISKIEKRPEVEPEQGKTFVQFNRRPEEVQSFPPSGLGVVFRRPVVKSVKLTPEFSVVEQPRGFANGRRPPPTPAEKPEVADFGGSGPNYRNPYRVIEPGAVEEGVKVAINGRRPFRKEQESREVSGEADPPQRNGYIIRKRPEEEGIPRLAPDRPEVTAPGPSAPGDATPRPFQTFGLDLPEEEYDVTLNDALQPSTLHPAQSLVETSPFRSRLKNRGFQAQPSFRPYVVPSQPTSHRFYSSEERDSDPQGTVLETREYQAVVVPATRFAQPAFKTRQRPREWYW